MAMPAIYALIFTIFHMQSKAAFSTFNGIRYAQSQYGSGHHVDHLQF